MKNYFTILILIFAFNANSQSMVVWLDHHKSVKGKGSDLTDAIKNKTQKYNQGADDGQLYTWRVLAGPRQGQLARAGIGPNWADFDSDIDPKEMGYWMDNVDPLIESSSGREYFVRVDNASYDVAKPGENMIGYNIDYVMSGDRNHFWKFRRNLVNALKESGEKVSVNVWNSSAGGPQGKVRVSFGFTSMEHYGQFRQIMGRVGEKYDEMYGEDSWETDLDLLRGSLQMWGAQTELLRFLPELSSPPISLQ